MSARPGPLARVLLAALAAYRAVSRLTPARCRFAPTCSSYAAEAVRAHGAARGGWLAARRVARCHPFHPGGHDPVPTARSTSGTRARTMAPAVPPARPAAPITGALTHRMTTSSR